MEGGLRWPRDPNRLGGGSDLLLGKAIELLARLPHVGDSDSLPGLGRPVGDATWSARAASGESHLLDHPIVLMQGRSVEIYDDTNSPTTLLDSGVMPRQSGTDADGARRDFRTIRMASPRVEPLRADNGRSLRIRPRCATSQRASSRFRRSN
jgi:hypothetical protein